jgi:hypothetical protein
MRLRRGIAIALGALALTGGGVYLAALSRDGPLGPVPGGPLEGVLVRDRDVDWTFAAPMQTLVLQSGGPPRSRTVWLLVHDGQLFVPSAYATAKRWPGELVDHWGEIARKYGPSPPDSYGDHWMFRMDPFEPRKAARPSRPSGHSRQDG